MTVLGCSPGTQVFGIIILQDDVLVEWDVLSLRGRWSPEKLDKILRKIEAILSEYDIEYVAVKIPDPFPTAIGFNQLIGSMNLLLERSKMKTHYFTLSELKKFCAPNKAVSKKTITEYVINAYSELIDRNKSPDTLPNNRRFKIFESVCAARLLAQKEIRNKN